MTTETTNSHTVAAAGTYVDPIRFEAERRAIFARQWTAIGDAARLGAPGAYVTAVVAG